MTQPRKGSTGTGRLEARQHLDWILVNEIEMAPPQWGRPLHSGYVRTIATGFDPDMFGAICIWLRRDLEVGHGRFMLVDGQHRLAAMRLMGYADQRVPCLIYEGLTTETAAELSLGLQERRNLHAVDRHRAALAAHERRAVEIDKVLRHLDLALVYTTRFNELRRISAVAMLANVWDCMGAPGLERVLRVCDGAWEGTSAGFAGTVMKLVMIVIAAHNGELDDQHLAATLGIRSPAAWICKDAAPRRPLGSLAQDVIIEYNKKARGHRRLPELTPSAYVTAAKRKPSPTTRGKIPGATITNTATPPSRRRGPGRYSETNIRGRT